MVKSVCQVSREDPITLPRVFFLLQSSLVSGLTMRFFRSVIAVGWLRGLGAVVGDRECS